LGPPAFLGLSIGGGGATTTMYAFIASSPFILVDQLNRPPFEVGVYLAILHRGRLAWQRARQPPLGEGTRVRRLLISTSLLSVAAASAFLAIVLSSHLTAISASH
jgi:DHA1 family bicyclomycin/chloramphenicol resistance-like MFS transporter